MIEQTTSCDALCGSTKTQDDASWLRIKTSEFGFTISVWRTMPQPGERHVCSGHCLIVWTRQWTLEHAEKVQRGREAVELAEPALAELGVVRKGSTI
jgi:hypothetical protein